LANYHETPDLSDSQDDLTPFDPDDIEVIPDDGHPDSFEDPDALAADEEMSDEPEGDEEDEDEQEALSDDDEDDDESDDDEPADAETKRKAAEYDQLQNRLQYEAQQRRNSEYWEGIESQAEDAFASQYDQIFVDAQGSLDPDAYIRQEIPKWTSAVTRWVKEFEASKRQAVAKAQERAAIPVYAAKIATYYKLSTAQAQELLEYDSRMMDREAQKMKRYNDQIARLKANNTQATRGKKKAELAGNPVRSGGSGRAAPIKVRAGSDNHLLALFAAAKAGR
jgi:hypothetical protein